MAIPRHTLPFAAREGIQRCTICGSPVRLVFRDGKYADHYEPIDTIFMSELQGVDEATAARLRTQRAGKRVVALVGMAPSSCSLAPYDEPGVEVWALNEMHTFSWMKRATRWFQMHKSSSYMRPMAKRGQKGHWEWLQKKRDIPIYMLWTDARIPDSVEYPLDEVVGRFFKNLYKGEARVKYFTSTLSYMIALALLEGFERIELYGFEMAATDEFAPQKSCAEFWLGLAMGLGVEIYLPPSCELLWGPLYGYQGGGPANLEGVEYD